MQKRLLCCNNTFRTVFIFGSLVGSIYLNKWNPSIHTVFYYLVIINLFTALVHIKDMQFCRVGDDRVPTRTLHFFSLAGGIFASITCSALFKRALHVKAFFVVQYCILVFMLGALYVIFNHADEILNHIFNFYSL